MATMNKPCYASILEYSPTKVTIICFMYGMTHNLNIQPVLIFVSSRRQTRLTALDLISYCSGDDTDPRRFLHMPEDDIISIAQTCQDQALKDTLVFGIGLHHSGLSTHDRQTVEELFLNNKIQVLVCTSTLAWGGELYYFMIRVKCA